MKLPKLDPCGADPCSLGLFTDSAIFTAAVNMTKSINMQGGPTGHVLELVRRIPGLEDAVAEGDLLLLREHGPAVHVEFKQRVRTPEAWSVIRSQDEREEASPLLLLVAEDSTEDARKLLDTHGIGIIDARGSAQIRFPGLVVHVERRGGGKRSAAASERRLAGRAAVAAQALLLDPDREWTVAGLARGADVSTTLAHYVLARLEKEGIVQSKGGGPRKVRVISNPSALLDLWAEEAHDRGVRGLSCYRFATTQRALTEDVSRTIADADIGHAVTGAAAADLLAPYLSAVPIVSLGVVATHQIVGKDRRLPADVARQRLGVRVHQQLVRVETQPLLRLPRPFHPIAVTLAWLDVADQPMPDEGRPLPESDEVDLLTGLIKKAHRDTCGVFRKK